jgi:hypothetical protein
MKLVVDNTSVLIDDEDYSTLAGLVPAGADWLIDRDGYLAVSFRCPRYRSRISINVHRWIMNAPTGLVVDHINNDRADNRKSNLRLVSKKQNSQNRRGQRNTSSAYKGVSRNKHGNWQAQIKINGKSKHLGSFINEKCAAKAYDKAAKEAYGEFAFQNFNPLPLAA